MWGPYASPAKVSRGAEASLIIDRLDGKSILAKPPVMCAR